VAMRLKSFRRFLVSKSSLPATRMFAPGYMTLRVFLQNEMCQLFETPDTVRVNELDEGGLRWNEFNRTTKRFG
jgi:hypothetical protein